MDSADAPGSMRLEIRRFQPTDIDALYRICLLTGENGQDATGLYADPFLLGHVYAAPYARHDPDLCLIATMEGVPCGYILGTADSAGFRVWSEEHWFPVLRERYALPDPSETSPDARLIRKLHAGYQPHHYAQVYPAHLHIDLLPCLQGRGVGADIMSRFLETLRERGCPGVHLVVSAANARGIAFYEKVGFHLLDILPGCRAYGRRLS
jgi:ribosomal protein S18 acetylase RimI-like enzyme